MRLVSIDPGKTSIAWAFFDADRLEQCGLIRSDSLADLAEKIWARFATAPYAAEVVIEIPQVYQQRLQKGDPNDLIDVAITAGMAAAILDDAENLELVRPNRWKGQRPKKICNQLTLKTLSAYEHIVLVRR